LERVSFRFKDFLCYSNRIGNDDDVIMFSFFIAGIRPKRIAMSLASIDVMFIELTCKCRIIELSVQMYATVVATCNFFMPLSTMMAML